MREEREGGEGGREKRGLKKQNKMRVIRISAH